MAKSRDITDIPTGFLLPHIKPSALQSSRVKYSELSSDPSQGLFIPKQLVATAVKLSLLGLRSDSFAIGSKTPVQLEQEAVWTPEKPWPLNEQRNHCQPPNRTRFSDHTGRRGQLKCDGTRTETRFRLSAKRTGPFKSAGGVSSVDYWQPRCAHQR